MTTTTNPGNFVDFDEYVGLKIDKTRESIRTTDLLTAVAGVAAMFLGYLLIFIVFDQWIVRDGFGVAWRWILLSTLVICTIAWLVWKVGIPSFRTVNGLFAAQEIEKNDPTLKSNLLNLIDLKQAGRHVNPAILKAIERLAAVRLQQVDVTQAIDHRPLVRTAYVLLTVIVLFCIYALLSPKKISNSIWRGLLPAADVSIATRTEILSVKPGNVTVPAHTQSVEVQVDLGGEIPPQVWLLYSSADGRFNRQPVELRIEAEGQTRFKGQLIGENAAGLMQDLTWFIRAGDAESSQYKLTVEQPPSAEIETVKIDFPAYMKLQSVAQANNGQIDAWEGANVVVSARTNMPVRSAMIQFLDDPQLQPTGEEISMSVTSDGRILQGQWTLALRADGSFPKYYRIDCRTEDGRRDTAPTNHGLTIRPDLPPEIVLLQPDRDIEAPANATIPLLIQASDPDFELGYIYLNAEKSGQKILRDQLSEGRQPKLILKHELHLSKLNAAAGDVIEIWAEAYDNKQPRPNSKNAPKIKIRVTGPVSMKDAERQLAEQRDQRDQKLADAKQETNPDRLDSGQPQDNSDADRQRANDTRPDDNDPKATDNPKDGQPQDNEGTKPNQNQQSSRKNSDQTSDRTKKDNGKPDQTRQKDDKNSSDATTQNDNGVGEQKPGKPLNSDGSQDDEAIRRLNEAIKRNEAGQRQQDMPQNQDEAGPSPDDNESRSKPPETLATEEQNTSPSASDRTTRKNEKSDSGRKPEKDRNENPSEGDSPSDDPAMKEDVSNKDQRQEKPSDKSDPDRKSRSKDAKVRKPDEDSKKPDSSMPDSVKSDSEKTPDADQNEASKPDESPSRKPGDQARTDKTPDPTAKSDKPKTDEGSDKADTDVPGDQTANEREKDTGVQPHSNEDAKGDVNKKVTSKEEQKTGKTDDEKKPTTGDDGKQSPVPDKTGTEKSRANDSDAAKKDSASDKNEQKDLPTGMNKNSPNRKDSQDADAPKADSDKNDKSGESIGPKEPVPDSPNSKKETADGTETGTAKPDRDPKSMPAPAKNEGVKPDPNEMPERRPGDTNSKNDARTPDKQSNQDTHDKKSKSMNESSEPEEPKTESDDKSHDKPDKSSVDPATKKDRQPTPSNQESDSKEPESDSSKQDDSKPGPAKKEASDDQNSNASKPDSDGGKKSAKSSKSAKKPGSKSGTESSESSSEKSDAQKEDVQKDDDGKKPGKEKADSDRSDDGKEDGKEDGEKVEEKSKSDGKKSDQNTKSGKNESGAGKGKGEKPGKGGSPDKSTGKPGRSSQSGKPGSNPDGDGMTMGDREGKAESNGDGSPIEPGDEANLEYNRQASELILQKLKKDLDRGDVDPELLEQLGWTQAEMRQFSDRLSKYLDESKRAEETPEDKARQQQYQEMLKNLDLQKSGARRSGETEPKRDVQQIESRRTPVPSAYRSAYEKYTKDLARQKSPSAAKPGK